MLLLLSPVASVECHIKYLHLFFSFLCFITLYVLAFLLVKCWFRICLNGSYERYRYGDRHSKNIILYYIIVLLLIYGHYHLGYDPFCLCMPFSKLRSLQGVPLASNSYNYIWAKPHKIVILWKYFFF